MKEFLRTLSVEVKNYYEILGWVWYHKTVIPAS
jgi:hypothetical protein